MNLDSILYPVNGFKIHVLKKDVDGDPLSCQGEIIKTIDYCINGICLNTSLVYADPFLFVSKGFLFLFYEEEKFRGKGFLAMTKTKDLKHWSKPTTVLKEDFHLSFPFVFEDHGQVWMVPESGHDNSIRLYVASEELTRFEFVTKLLEGKEYVDSSIVYKDGRYYLFTTEKNDRYKYSQRLFVSESLVGPYNEHPSSPIYNGGKYGRNAGSILKHKESFFRSTQDCTGGYGNNVSFLRIIEMTPFQYKEELYKEDVLDTSSPFFTEGGHQYNFVKFNNRIIIATDAHYMSRKPNLGVIVQRILRIMSIR